MSSTCIETAGPRLEQLQLSTPATGQKGHSKEYRTIRDKPYVHTPLVYSPFMSAASGLNVWLKLENAQPSGSFKSRGLGAVVASAVRDNPGKQLHFVIASGGNAGYATAYAASSYGQLCTVCVPSSADRDIVRRIELTGATVKQVGTYIAEADGYVRDELMPRAAAAGATVIYCHPYNSPIVWEGNSSVIDELVTDARLNDFKPDAVVCSVGGGGLYNGIVLGLQRHGMGHVPVLAVETEGCCALNESLRMGRQVSIDKPNTVAGSLATINVTQETIAHANCHPTRSVTVTDKAAVAACATFAQDHKLIVEPACGTAMVPIYSGEVKKELSLRPGANLIVIVCGGVNITSRKLLELCTRFDVDPAF